MAEHTPGPWSVHAWGSASGRRFCIETADHAHGIASIAPNETASTMLTMEQHEANARLIAAAPDLLAVCEELDRAIVIDPDSGKQVIPGNRLLQAVREARAAIAKAKGGAK